MSYEWMYGDQEREEREFEHMTEEEMCYAEAKNAFAERDKTRAIKELTELGDYVLVHEQGQPTRMLGKLRTVYGIYHRFEDAVNVMNRDNLHHHDGESGYYVAFPVMKMEPVVPEIDNSCPF